MSPFSFNTKVGAWHTCRAGVRGGASALFAKLEGKAEKLLGGPSISFTLEGSRGGLTSDQNEGATALHRDVPLD